MDPAKDSKLRSTIVKMLIGENAHADIETVLSDVPIEKVGILHGSLPYTIWQLMEHIRITQWDIVEFSVNPNHVSPSWPEGLWPAHKKPFNQDEYDNSLNTILRERDRMAQLIMDTSNDLLQPFPHGTGQNLLREAILIIDHNSHHLGQIIVLKRLLGIHK